jgi:hypothetical protein
MLLVLALPVWPASAIVRDLRRPQRVTSMLLALAGLVIASSSLSAPPRSCRFRVPLPWQPFADLEAFDVGAAHPR